MGARDGAASAGLRRPRVVVEAPTSPWHWLVKEAQSLTAFDVQFCSGPAGRSDHQCPLVAGSRCPLVEQADVVITGLGLDDPQTREIVAALRAEFPATPLVVLAKQGEARRLRELLADCNVIPFPWTAQKMAAAVSSALEARDRSG